MSLIIIYKSDQKVAHSYNKTDLFSFTLKKKETL